MAVCATRLCAVHSDVWTQHFLLWGANGVLVGHWCPPFFPSLLFHVVRSDVLCKNEFFASVMFDCICDMARLHPMHCKWAPDKMQELSLSIEHLFLCLCLGFLNEKHFLSVYFGDGCGVLDMQWTFNSTCMLLWMDWSLVHGHCRPCFAVLCENLIRITMMAEHLFCTFCKCLWCALQASHMFCVCGTVHFFAMFLFLFGDIPLCRLFWSSQWLFSSKPQVDHGSMEMFGYFLFVFGWRCCFPLSLPLFLFLLWMFLSSWWCSEGWLWPFSRTIKKNRLRIWTAHHLLWCKVGR